MIHFKHLLNSFGRKGIVYPDGYDYQSDEDYDDEPDIDPYLGIMPKHKYNHKH